MSDLISTIQPDEVNANSSDKEEQEESEELETTSLENIEEYKVKLEGNIILFMKIIRICTVRL